jgi:AcrR family transcriptional regulator
VAKRGTEPRRSRLAPDLRRAQVLEVARQQFVSSGLSGVSMKEIARAVGVTETAIYHHFGSKEELFRQAIEAPLHALVNNVRSRMRELAEEPGMSRREILAAANEAFLAAMVEMAPLLAVTLFSEGLEGRRLYTTEIWPQLTEAVEAMMSAGWSQERTDPQLATLGFLGVHYGVVMDSVLAEERLDVPRAAAQITALFEGSVARRELTPPPSAGPREAGGSATSRKRMAAPDRRRLIIDAARQAFLEVGLARVRMRDVAERADLTEAGLYAHFGSKDELFREAVREPLELAVATFAAGPGAGAGGPGDGGTALARANEQLLACLVELAPLLALALFSEVGEGQRLYQQSLLPLLQNGVERILRAVYADDPPVPDALRALVDGVLGLHLGVALDNFLRGRPVDVPQVAAQLAEMITLPGLPAEAI